MKWILAIFLSLFLYVLAEVYIPPIFKKDKQKMALTDEEMQKLLQGKK